MVVSGPVKSITATDAQCRSGAQLKKVKAPGFQREGTRSNHCRAKMLRGGLSGCGWDDQGGLSGGVDGWVGSLSQLEPKAAGYLDT